MNTALSLNEIECALAKYFDVRKNIIVCNVSWGFLDYEADMLILSKAGLLTEVEIKRSLEDLRADFDKKHTHNDKRISYFYYCVPESLLENTKELISKSMVVHSGILTNNESGRIKLHNADKNFCLSNNGKIYNRRKLYIEEQLDIARLGAMRVWNFKQKQIEKK